MSSRLDPLPPDALVGDQKTFYKELQGIIDGSFGTTFETRASDGSFIGPFGIFVHNPGLGRHFFAAMIELAKLPGLPLAARQVTILTVAGHFKSAYPEYAHSRLTLGKTSISQEDIDSVLTGGYPEGLDQPSSVAYALAKELMEKRGPLDKGVWEEAERVLGKEGTAAAVHFVGFYAYTCLVLNGFDAKAPVEKNLN